MLSAPCTAVWQSPPPPTAEAPSARRRAAPPEVFEDGLGHYYADDFESAAAEMFDYLSTNEDTVENYEWAEYFLGVSLLVFHFANGLWTAAITWG